MNGIALLCAENMLNIFNIFFDQQPSSSGSLLDIRTWMTYYILTASYKEVFHAYYRVIQ